MLRPKWLQRIIGAAASKKGLAMQMEFWDREKVFEQPVPATVSRPVARYLRASLSTALLICDLVSMGLAIGLTLLFLIGSPLSEEIWTVILAIVLSYLVLAGSVRAYDTVVIRYVSRSMNRTVKAIVGTSIIVSLIGYLTIDLTASNFNWIAAATFIFASSILTGRFVFDKLISRHYHRVLFDRVLILDGVQVEPLSGFRNIDVRRRGIEPDSNDPMMRHWASLFLSGADRVVVACHPDRYRLWAQFLCGSGVPIEIIMPELNALDAVDISRHGRNTTIGISNNQLSSRNRFVKRCFDLLISIPILILSMPVMLLCSAIIKWSDGGPVLFLQTRMGRGNRLFSVFKFRTMNSSSDGSCEPTRSGVFLRKTSLDELPQLFNVIRGDMSLVGPRPHALDSRAENQLFWEVDEKYWNRHAIKPGMTGLAQIRGFRGCTRCRNDLTNRLRSDMEYLRGWSIWRDLAILVATIRVLVHKNAY